MAARCLLCYITDRTQFRGDEPTRRRELLLKIAEAAKAGVDYIQLREKDLSAGELETLTREALKIIRNESPLRTENRERTYLLLNSRTDIALATGADGVHLRSDDIAPTEVRQMLALDERRERRERREQRPLPANHFLIAASCHTAAEILRAESEQADFAVFAAVFGKKISGGISAPGAQPAGLAALREACPAKIPVLALGGVTLENAASCLDAGAAGVAGIRLFQENKIEEVVRALRPL
jgi:thiamine-phosphate pyrophosphorylase